MCKGGGGLGKIVGIGLAVAGAVTGNVGLISAGLSSFGQSQQAKQASKAQKSQDQANATADANSKAALSQQEQAMNKANAKAPNVAALLTKNETDSSLGGTNLTGIGGVARTDLQLGKNTLLGE